jgi:alkylhydroperoxidase family enzyme
LEELYKRYGDQVEFLAVYVREAHPTDGWRSPGNDRAGISIAQPRQFKERLAVAKRCCAALDISMPVLVDDMNDSVGHAYSGMPDRLYLIDRDGRVAYKGGRGPFGFKAREMEQSLLMMMLDQETKPTLSQHGIPIVSDTEAWKRLPRADRGANQPLPQWARALVTSLPKTTAAMLELDYVQRVKSPLDATLRGKMRWVAAHANRCAYSEAYALADLRRAGLDEAGIQALLHEEAGVPSAERVALQFARKMSLAADTVTDAEVSQLMGAYGSKQVVAMVQLLAYANFQDRLILSFGLTLEKDGPLPPLEVHFIRGPMGTDTVSVPPRNSPQGISLFSSPVVGDTDWLNMDFGQLQKEMEGQRVREPRILVPTWEDLRKTLPASMTNRPPVRIRWSLVCYGYQPELTLAWGSAMGMFGQEARQDRVFEETLFWVITRSLHCFY